jgi:dCTP deaminase
MSTLENGKKVPSYGLSSYGYDIRLGNKFTPFKAYGFNQYYESITDGVTARHMVENLISDTPDSILDVCDFDTALCNPIYDVDEIIMPPNGFMLGVSMERINMPDDCLAICTGKSTIARCGLHVVVTPLEPGWSGFITLEIHNMTGMAVKLTAGMGITQLVFLQSDERCVTSYSDRKGKYQNQGFEPVLPRQK